MSKLSTTTDSAAMKPRPVHPGEILREDFMAEYGLTAGTLAKRIGVPRDRIEKIIRESRAVTADTAVRLARLFGTSPQFWLNLQTNHDLCALELPLEAMTFPPLADPQVGMTGFAEAGQEPYLKP